MAATGCKATWCLERKGQAMPTFLSMLGLVGLLAAFTWFSIRATAYWEKLLRENDAV